MTSAQIAAQLHAAIDGALPVVLAVDDTRTTKRPRPDGWCAREVLGHLIDSACNNHRRFVTGQFVDAPVLESYDQDRWVRTQHYDKIAWRDLVTLWTAYNRHLAQVMSCTPDAALARTFTASDGRTVTLEYLMEDYVVHLRHHLEQVRALVQA